MYNLENAPKNMYSQGNGSQGHCYLNRSGLIQLGTVFVSC